MGWGEVRTDSPEYGTHIPRPHAPYRPQPRKAAFLGKVECMQGGLVSMGPQSMGSISGLFGYPHHHHHHRVNQKINENHPTTGNIKFMLSFPHHLQHPHPSVTVPHPCVHFLGTANLEGPLDTASRSLPGPLLLSPALVVPGEITI